MVRIVKNKSKAKIRLIIIHPSSLRNKEPLDDLSRAV